MLEGLGSSEAPGSVARAGGGRCLRVITRAGSTWGGPAAGLHQYIPGTLPATRAGCCSGDTD